MAVSAVGRAEVEDFLFAESALLDERRYRDWYDLLTPDIVYELPMIYNRLPDPKGETWDPAKDVVEGLSWMLEDYESLRLRIERFFLGTAWAEVPPSRTRHLITNVRVTGVADDGDITVASNFMVYRSRLSGRRGEDEDFFVGSRVDVLRRVDGSLRLARRTATLDCPILNSHNISFLI